jgi:hypothetical protein
MGGAARLAGIKTYEERALNVAETPRGKRETKVSTLLALPGQARFERTSASAGGTFEMANVVTPSGAFTSFNKDGRAVNAFTRAYLEHQRDRLLINVLRAATAGGAEVGVAGTMTAGGATLEKVMVRAGDEWVALGIDPASARIGALQYRGKGQGGEMGDVTQTFADHRPVDGLVLPFKIGLEFNGQPTANSDLAVESIVVNGPIDAAIFTFVPAPKKP